MVSKKSKDFGKKIAERAEPLSSLKKFVRACRQSEAEDIKLLGPVDAYSAGEMVFGFVRKRGARHKTKVAAMMDEFLNEAKKWGL